PPSNRAAARLPVTHQVASVTAPAVMKVTTRLTIRASLPCFRSFADIRSPSRSPTIASVSWVIRWKLWLASAGNRSSRSGPARAPSNNSSVTRGTCTFWPTAWAARASNRVAPIRIRSLAWFTASVLLQRCEAGAGQQGEIGGRQFNFQAALSGTDKNGVELLCRGVDKGFQTLLLAQGADPAQDITGAALNVLFIGHGRFLRARSFGELLEAEQGCDRHHANGKFLAVNGNDQGFEHPARLYPHLFRGLVAIAVRRRIVLVFVHDITDFGFLGGENSGGHAGSSCRGDFPELKHEPRRTSPFVEHGPAFGDLSECGVEDGKAAELQEYRLTLGRAKERPVACAEWNLSGKVQHRLIA